MASQNQTPPTNEIDLSTSLCGTGSIPIGLLFNFNFLDKEPKILPLPHPISSILEFLLSFFFFNRNELKELIYVFDDSHVLLSQFFNVFT